MPNSRPIQISPGFGYEHAIATLSSMLDNLRSQQFRSRSRAASRDYSVAYSNWAARNSAPYGPRTLAQFNREMGNRYGFNARGEPDLPTPMLPPSYARPPGTAPTPEPTYASDERTIDYRYPYQIPNYFRSTWEQL